MINLSDYITLNRNIRFGKPTVIGTRITVSDVLNWLSEGISVENIIENFPQLNKEQINACLKYAATKETKLAVA